MHKYTQITEWKCEKCKDIGWFWYKTYYGKFKADCECKFRPLPKGGDDDK